MEKAYSLDNLKLTLFDSTDIPNLWALEGGSISYRLTSAQLAALPDDKRDIDALRCRLSELFHEKLQDSYAKLESECDIKRDTFQKMMRYKNGRNVTYPQLAKFCVGAKLSVADSRELFSMMGYELNERNRCDYVLLCELQEGGDILDYDADMKEHCRISILTYDGRNDLDKPIRGQVVR